MRRRRSAWLLAVNFFLAVALLGCAMTAGRAASPHVDTHYGYVMSQASNAIVVIDTATSEVVRRVKHADMVKPAGGRFHPSLKRYYAGGVGKITIWDTTDVSNPRYLKTVVPAVGSRGEYRGFLIHRGSTSAIDGNVWMANIQDSTVYVFRAGDLERLASPQPITIFNAATAGIDVPHFLMSRPLTNEIWLTNRPVNGKGFVMRFDGDANAVLTAPSAKLETTSTVGDEPNELSFSKDGRLAYIGHHGHVITGSPANQMNVAIVDAASFTVKKLVPMVATATTPGYVDIDPDAERVYFTTKWTPNLVVFDTKTEQVLRYIDLGGFGPGYGVALTPDRKRLFIPLGAPAQSAVAVVDTKTLTVVANIVDSELLGPRSVRFTNY